MSMVTLHVALSKIPRGGGPGDVRLDIPVEVPDRSEASFELAYTTAAEIFQQQHPCQAVWHYGTY